MVTRRRKAALLGAFLLGCVLLFLAWAVLSPNYEAAKKFSDEMGDEPYTWQPASERDNEE
ncbi:MAG: hypothetical protein AAGF92_01390 [Myxococcota bacterium]